MNYVYSIMWAGIAVFLFVMGAKDSKLYTFCGTYFVFNAVWWFAGALSKYDMFHNTLGWVYRGITAAFLIVGLCLYFFIYKKKNNSSDSE